MGREREINWKELSLKARIESLKAAESVLTGKVIWWEMAGQPPIDERGGELEEIRRLGDGAEGYFSEAIRLVRQKREKAITVVMSGGGAMAPIHVGVLGALLEAGIPIDLSIGTSAGSIGAIMAPRLTSLDAWLRAKRMAETIGWDDLRTVGAVRRGGLWATEKLAEYIDENITRFETTGAATILAIVDISRFPQQRLRVQWEPIEGTTLGDMTRASCAVPGLMAPVKLGSTRLWDGGAKFGEGFEPVVAAQVIVPESLVVSVRLGPPLKPQRLGKGREGAVPHIRIQPCRGARDQVRDMLVFDPNDVYLGYLAGMEMVEEIWELMEERGIEKVHREGFLGRGQLLEYFGNSDGI